MFFTLDNYGGVWHHSPDNPEVNITHGQELPDPETNPASTRSIPLPSINKIQMMYGIENSGTYTFTILIGNDGTLWFHGSNSRHLLQTHTDETFVDSPTRLDLYCHNKLIYFLDVINVNDIIIALDRNDRVWLLGNVSKMLPEDKYSQITMGMMSYYCIADDIKEPILRISAHLDTDWTVLVVLAATKSSFEIYRTKSGTLPTDRVINTISSEKYPNFNATRVSIPHQLEVKQILGNFDDLEHYLGFIILDREGNLWLLNYGIHSITKIQHNLSYIEIIAEHDLDLFAIDNNDTLHMSRWPSEHRIYWGMHDSGYRDIVDELKLVFEPDLRLSKSHPQTHIGQISSVDDLTFIILDSEDVIHLYHYLSNDIIIPKSNRKVILPGYDNHDRRFYSTKRSIH